jgi:hypothetical protein
LFVSVFTFIVCYLRSFVLPNAPIALWGDLVGFFNDGSRLVSGQLPYRDYFQIVPPGTDLVYAILIKCFGLKIWIPNLLMVFLASLTALLMTLICARLVRGMAVLLPGLLLCGFSLSNSLDATHHWFSTLAILACVLIFMEEITPLRIVAGGVLCGLAACFTQPKGILALGVIATWLFWSTNAGPIRRQGWIRVIFFVSFSVATFVLVNWYFIHAAGVSQWLFCIFEFPFRYYRLPAVNNWGVIGMEVRSHANRSGMLYLIFDFALFPIAFAGLIAALNWGKVAQKKNWVNLVLVAAMAAAMLLAVASAPSLKRIGTASPLALILFVWMLSSFPKLRLGLSTVALALALFVPIRIQLHPRSYLELPSGRAAFLDQQEHEEYAWVLSNTRPGDFFFGLPPLYYSFHLQNPAPIEVLVTSDYTRPEQVASVIEALEKYQVELVVLRDSHVLLKKSESQGDHLNPFRTYLTRNYRLIKSFRIGDDVWQRAR